MFGIGVSHGQLENVLESALVNGLVKEGRAQTGKSGMTRIGSNGGESWGELWW